MVLATLPFFPGWWDAASLPKSLLSILPILLSTHFILEQLYKLLYITVVKIILSLACALFISALISLLFSDDLYTSIYGVLTRYLGLGHLALLILGFLAAFTFYNSKGAATMLGTIAVLGVLESMIAISQMSGFKLANYTIENPIVGTFANSNYLSGFLGFASIALIYFYLFTKDNLFKFFLVLLLFLHIYAIYICGSLQGFFILGIGFYGAFYRLINASKTWKTTYLIASIPLATLALTGLFGKGPLKSLLFQASTSYRFDYWRAALNMLRQSPLLGVGPDHFKYNYVQFRDTSAIRSRSQVIADNPHNIFLSFATSYGLIFAFFFLISVTFVCILALKHLSRNLREKRVFDATDAFSLILLGYIIQGLIAIDTPSSTLFGAIAAGCVVRTSFNKRHSAMNEKIVSNHSGGKHNFKKQLKRRWIRLIFPAALWLMFSIPPAISMSEYSSAVQSSNKTTRSLTEIESGLFYYWHSGLAIDRELWIKWVELLFVQGRVDDAKTLLLQMSKTWPEENRVLTYTAQILLYQNKPQEALRLREKVYLANPRDSENLKFLISLAVLLKDRTRFDIYSERYLKLFGVEVLPSELEWKN
jgi:O-antigen ligase